MKALYRSTAIAEYYESDLLYNQIQKREGVELFIIYIQAPVSLALHALHALHALQGQQARY